MNIAILTVGCVLFFLYYVWELRKVHFDVRLLVQVAMFVALSSVLGLVVLYRFPQGGSLALASMLPIMVLSVEKGVGVGMTAGLVAALIGLINGATVIHPAQFLLDYILPFMVFGLSGILGLSKPAALIGAVLASLLSLFCNVLSGVIFFASYTPEGMNMWYYSIGYNVSTNGVEMLLSVVLLAVLPLRQISSLLVDKRPK